MPKILNRCLGAFKNNWRSSIFALVSGLLLPFSLAPYNLWPLGFASVALFFFILSRVNSGRNALWLSWCYGLGMYGYGVSWIFVSIYLYGHTSFALALVMISLFVMFMALLFALPFYIYGRWLHSSSLGVLLALPALWIIGEWTRTWLFTGFPWLFLGYAHIDTWLSGWAPIGGVMTLSLVIAFCGSTLIFMWLNRHKPVYFIAPILVCAGFWLSGLLLKPIEWTHSVGDPINVAMVQGNIPQDKKMDPTYIFPPIERYVTMSDELWKKNDWVIWPEAAVPLIMHLYGQEQAVDELFAHLRAQAIQNNSALVLGIRYYSKTADEFYNAIVGLGLGSGIYFKQRLVPFGEYVPFEEQLRGLINFFNLPTSIVAVGPYNERGIQIGGAILSPSICYEIVYPDSVAQRAVNADILITISNDAWFGGSIGPQQHMQIAQMRALETGRELIRSTNTGVSAFVDHRGNIKSETAQFVAQSLEDQVQLRRGATPFMQWGSEPVVLAAMMMVLLGALAVRKNKRRVGK